MDNIVSLDETKLKYLLDQEARKIVGKVCKRVEITQKTDKGMFKQSVSVLELTELKKQIKELLYEFTRDLNDSIILLTKKDSSLHLVNGDETKKE
jgi:hypothetical protein